MAREAVKITQYLLTRGEVLALHLYSSPEFVPMNGICRSYPPSILELLRGDGGAAGDNRLCTTLFCVSSGLKKLARATDLPASWCAARPPLPPCRGGGGEWELRGGTWGGG